MKACFCACSFYGLACPAKTQIEMVVEKYGGFCLEVLVRLTHYLANLAV